MIRYFAWLGVLFAVLSSCGTSYHEEEIKDYTLATDSHDPVIKDELARLTKDFNDSAGFEAIKFSYDISHANSIITITKGLDSRDGNLGYGQWIAEIDEESSATRVTGGRQPHRTTVYSMKIEFDEDYLVSHLNPTTPAEKDELRTLYFHEVGHGLQMNHDPEVSSVMYKYISGTKDFASFFGRVRQYFGI